MNIRSTVIAVIRNIVPGRSGSFGWAWIGNAERATLVSKWSAL